MDQNNIINTTTSTDDASVLRVLLHNIKGISPVAGPRLDFVPVEEELQD